MTQRWQALASMLNTAGTIGLEIQTNFGRVDFEAKREAGEEKTVLVVMRNQVTHQALQSNDDLTYEQVQDKSIQEAIDMLLPYKIPQMEIVYGKPFI